MQPITRIPDKKNSYAFQFVKHVVDQIKTDKPLVIGITGAGGAGKTTFGNNIVRYFGKDQCVSIDLDDYLMSRTERGKLGLTGYHPRANNLYLARENIENLVQGKTILKPVYDHSTGKTLDSEEIKPKELIILEGVTTLYDQLRKINDLSFFLDALEETQIKSRIERDVHIRGYSVEEALILFESLKPLYQAFIEPTKKYASAVFEVDTEYVMHPTHIDEKLR